MIEAMCSYCNKPQTGFNNKGILVCDDHFKKNCYICGVDVNEDTPTLYFFSQLSEMPVCDKCYSTLGMAIWDEEKS